MDYAIISVPAAPVRRKPMHRKEMVSQLLFGETVKVLKEKGPLWVKIRSLHDNYEGWVTNTMLEEIDEVAATTRSAFVATDLLNTISIGDKMMNIPIGSSLPFFENGKGKSASKDFSFNGNYLKRDEQQPSAELIKKLSNQWINVPYMWGGRSPLGVDCSGLTQVVFKLIGIDLPRDAWQQAQEGKAIKKFADAMPGDLAFFDNKEDIVHVGILLGGGKIIHASGRVRVDDIDKKGIDKKSGSIHTKLKAIRRYF